MAREMTDATPSVLVPIAETFISELPESKGKQPKNETDGKDDDFLQAVP